MLINDKDYEITGSTYVYYTYDHKPFLIDKEDREKLRQYEWKVDVVRPNYKRIVSRQTRNVRLGRFLLGIIDGCVVDHRDGNGFNNQKQNLRIVTYSQNAMNSKISTKNKTGYKGVSMTKYGRYDAHACINGKQYYIGRYLTAEEAAHAYDKFARTIHGEYGCYNFPTGGERKA